MQPPESIRRCIRRREPHQVADPTPSLDETTRFVDGDEAVDNGQLGDATGTQVCDTEVIGLRLAEEVLLIAIRRPAHHVEHLPGELGVDPGSTRRWDLFTQHAQGCYLATFPSSMP